MKIIRFLKCPAVKPVWLPQQRQAKAYRTSGFRRWRVVHLILLLAPAIPIFAAQSKGYGPEVKSFLEYVRHEEVELNFQIEHKEIARKDYLRSKTRLEILREAVLTRVKQTGQDLVPEYHVVATDEVEELIPGGTEALKGVKAGDVVLTKWKSATPSGAKNSIYWNGLSRIDPAPRRSFAGV
jgi:hypothetical protein